MRIQTTHAIVYVPKDTREGVPIVSTIRRQSLPPGDIRCEAAMRDQRPRPNPVIVQPRPTEPIPDDQARALDRRHALDEQQRTFRNGIPRPHFPRTRPPG